MQVPRVPYAPCAAEFDSADALAGEPCDPEHDLDIETFEEEVEPE